MPIGDGQVMGRIRSFLTEPTFGNVAGMTPEDVARRRALAQALWSEGNNSEPVTSIFGGMNKMLQSFLGGRQLWKAENTDIAVRDRADQQQQAGLQQMAEFAYPGQQSPSTAPAPSQSFNAGQADEWSTGDWPGGTGQQQVPASQQEFIDMMMPYAIEASQRTGIDPRIIIAQSAQETGWGRSAPGNNYFGIKSHGQAGGNSLSTTEYVNGQPVRINDSFRAYGSPAESVAGYADFMLQNGRYEPMRSAQGLDAQLAALGQSGYATDPGYANSVGQIARGINLPTANPTGEFVRGLIENPQTRPMAQALIEQEIVRLTTPPAPVDREVRNDQNGVPRYVDTGELVFPGVDAAPTPINFGDEEALRDNFRMETSDYRLVQGHFQRLQAAAANPSAAGDVAMVFAFMKMLDPGSVVRETEYATAQNAAGVPAIIQNMWNRVLSGERLAPEQRADFLGQAQSLFSATEQQYTATEQRFRSIAEQYGMDPNRIFGGDALPAGGPPGAAPAAPAVPGAAPAPAAAAAAGGTPPAGWTAEEWNALTPEEQATIPRR